MAESLTQRLANGAVSLGSDRTVRLVGFVAFVVMALFMVLRIGILPAASAGDDVWYDESGYWLLNAGQLARAIHDNAAGDGIRDFLPPMTGVFTAGSFALFGYTQFAVGIVPTASCALGGLLCVMALRRRFTARWGPAFAVTVVPFFTPLLLKVVGHNRFEAQVYLFFCAAMLAAAVRGDVRLSRGRAMSAGFLTGLATISYYPASPLVILTLFAWTIVDNKAWGQLTWFIAGGALALAGFLAWIGPDFGFFLEAMRINSSRYVETTSFSLLETVVFTVPALATAGLLAVSRQTWLYALLVMAGFLLRFVTPGFQFEAALAMMAGLATLLLQPKATAGWSAAIRFAGRYLVIGIAALTTALAVSGLWVSWNERADRDYAAFERNLLSVMPPNHGGLVLIDRPAHLALRPRYGRSQLHHLVGPDAQTGQSMVLDDPRQIGRVEAVIYWPPAHAGLREIAHTTPLLQAFLQRPYHTVWVSPHGVGEHFVRGGKPYEVMVLIPDP